MTAFELFHAIAGPAFFIGLFYAIGRAAWVHIIVPEIENERADH